MRFSKEWLEEVLTVNPVVLFAHKDWTDSDEALENFREAGMDDVHVVQVNGHSGELPIIHQIARHLNVAEGSVNTCRVFIGKQCVGDAASMPKGRELLRRAVAAGATAHTPPPPPLHPHPQREHSPDRLFVANKKGQP